MYEIPNHSEADVIRNGQGFILESAAEVGMFKCMCQWWGYTVTLGDGYMMWDDLYDAVEERLGSRQLFMESFFYPLPNHNKPIPDIVDATEVEEINTETQMEMF